MSAAALDKLVSGFLQEQSADRNRTRSGTTRTLPGFWESVGRVKLMGDQYRLPERRFGDETRETPCAEGGVRQPFERTES